MSAGVICSNLPTRSTSRANVFCTRCSFLKLQSVMPTKQWVEVVEPRTEYAAGNNSGNSGQEGTGAHGAASVCEEQALHTSATCWSSVRCRSNVTTRLLIVADGSMTASETCSDGASSTDCRPLPVVNRIASDLLGFSCRPLCSNHWCTCTLFECVGVHFEVVLWGCNVHLAVVYILMMPHAKRADHCRWERGNV